MVNKIVEGEVAYREGKSKNSCPYKYRTKDWLDWNTGWVEEEGRIAWRDQLKCPDTSGYLYHSWQYSAFEKGYIEAAKTAPASV